MKIVMDVLKETTVNDITMAGLLNPAEVLVRMIMTAMDQGTTIISKGMTIQVITTRDEPMIWNETDLTSTLEVHGDLKEAVQIHMTTINRVITMINVQTVRGVTVLPKEPRKEVPAVARLQLTAVVKVYAEGMQ